MEKEHGEPIPPDRILFDVTSAIQTNRFSIGRRKMRRKLFFLLLLTLIWGVLVRQNVAEFQWLWGEVVSWLQTVLEGVLAAWDPDQAWSLDGGRSGAFPLRPPLSLQRTRCLSMVSTFVFPFGLLYTFAIFFSSFLCHHNPNSWPYWNPMIRTSRREASGKKCGRWPGR